MTTCSTPLERQTVKPTEQAARAVPSRTVSSRRSVPSSAAKGVVRPSGVVRPLAPAPDCVPARPFAAAVRARGVPGPGPRLPAFATAPAQAEVTHEYLPGPSKEISKGVPTEEPHKEPEERLSGPLFEPLLLTFDSGGLWVDESAENSSLGSKVQRLLGRLSVADPRFAVHSGAGLQMSGGRDRGRPCHRRNRVVRRRGRLSQERRILLELWPCSARWANCRASGSEPTPRIKPLAALVGVRRRRGRELDQPRRLGRRRRICGRGGGAGWWTSSSPKRTVRRNTSREIKGSLAD